MTAAVSPPRQRLTPSHAQPLARFALAGVAFYVSIDVLLAFLRPGYSLLYNAESDYGHGGPWAWLMDLNFLLRCALSLAAAGAIAKSAEPGGRIRTGLALLAAWAVCSGLLAFFPDNLEGQPVHGSGVVHIALALIAFPCVAVAAIVITAHLRLDPRWRGRFGLLLTVAIAGAVVLLVLGTAGHKHAHAPGGLYERVFLGLELLWIALAAAHVALMRSPGRPARPLSADAGVRHVR
jgi:hypothetical membrane protein